MLGWLSFLKPVIKSKWTWIAITVIGIGVFVWNYGTLREDLGAAYSNIQRLGTALDTTNESLNRLEKEIERWDSILIKREKERREIQKEYEQTKEELMKERSRNEKLNACWDVEFSSEWLRSKSESGN